MVKIYSKIQDNGSKYIVCDWQYEKLVLQGNAKKKNNLNKINILKVKVQSKNVNNGNGKSNRNSFLTEFTQTLSEK